MAFRHWSTGASDQGQGPECSDSRRRARANGWPARRYLLIAGAVGLLVCAPVTGVLLVLRSRAVQASSATYFTPPSASAEWEGNWEFSELGADPSEAGTERVRIPFNGTDFALQVRRGNFRGTFYVAIDGEPANHLPRDDRGAYLILTSPDLEPQVVTIPVAAGLADGPHVAEVVADRAWDQWPLAGWRVGRTPISAPSGRTVAWWAMAGILSLAGLLGALALWLFRSAPRRGINDASDAVSGQRSTAGIGPAQDTWTRSSGTLLFAMAAAAALFYFSPYLPLTVLSGLALAGLVLLRFDLGLALVAGLAPFYLKPRPLGAKAFSMAEIVVLLCAISWSARRLTRWVQLLRGRDTRNWRDLLPALDRHLGPSASLDLAVFFYVLMAVASFFVADYRHVALRELRVLVFEPALFYLMARTTRLGRRSMWCILDLFVVGAVAVALIGLVQYVMGVNVITAEGGLRRLRSVYGSPNSVGLYLGRALPVLAAVALLGAARRRRLAYGVAALPVVAAIVLSFSKGALLIGVPASLLAVGVLAGGRWLVGALGAAGAAVLAAIPLARTPRFASLFDTRSGTTFFRIQLWQSAWDMFRDHPWLGVGPDNFLYSFRGRYIRPAAWQEPHISQAHNIALDYATRMGISGLIAGVWIQAAFWRLALPLRALGDRDRRALALGLMGSMVSFLAHGMVDASHFLVDLAFVLFLTLGVVQLLARSEANEL